MKKSSLLASYYVFDLRCYFVIKSVFEEINNWLRANLERSIIKGRELAEILNKYKKKFKIDNNELFESELVDYFGNLPSSHFVISLKAWYYFDDLLDKLNTWLQDNQKEKYISGIQLAEILNQIHLGGATNTLESKIPNPDYEMRKLQIEITD